MTGKLYTPPKLPGLREVMRRILFVALLLCGVTLIVYFEGGLRDSRSGTHPGFWDCFYFALVTITTVGYGDIVPVDTMSRLVDAIVLTPVRFIVWMTIFGTAYQLTLRRFQEEYRMKSAVRKLDQHIVLCGCGATGMAALRELLLQGTAPDQIVVLDTNGEEGLEEASALGVVCITGDATREQVLQSVAIERAAHVLVAPGRDDTAVLITLTVRDMNPHAQLTAMCCEAENVKQLQRAGAHHIVHPAFAGGSLMAATTRRAHLADTLKDLLSVGGVLHLEERTVQEAEIGVSPHVLKDIAVLRVYRGDAHYEVHALPCLEKGDVLVYVAATSP